MQDKERFFSCRVREGRAKARRTRQNRVWLIWRKKEMRLSSAGPSKEIHQGNVKGKSSWIIIVAEGKAKAHNIARIISKKTDLETRVAVLGHIRRGGHPTAIDRILASQLGSYAVKILRDGQTDLSVNMKNDILGTIPLSVAIQAKKNQSNSDL